MKKGMKTKNKKNTKGLSPVIATVLLITIVIIIALIVFLWVRGMTQEAITKNLWGTGDENVQLVCGKVQFEATYTAATGLHISNTGNVPMFGMKVQIVKTGEHNTLDLRNDSANWPEVGLNTGGIFSDPGFSTQVGSAKEIVLIPVLIGESDSGKKTYVCDENEDGYRITI
jgi:flagellin-like protein